ncbi:hypothetical protein SY83_14570 [Paenibacillus swuensis]|uniref:DUF3024 domain-containing protein n=1 Tax=Paenibacillus swuensis TaxID=1178515 RepID=A0A172TJS8_9BACL|nr:DUF3024 domain-containing protein [Paenibacillus swuensis]ANE47288.1 hypothetical protein SY83_14570 [Paenibacillus swuensis]
MLDPFTKTRLTKILDKYCNKIPKHLQDEYQIKYKFRGETVTLFEDRPAFRSESRVQIPIAQFRLDEQMWKVYWSDSKSKWHHVGDIKPHSDFERQLKIVDENNQGVFWG